MISMHPYTILLLSNLLATVNGTPVSSLRLQPELSEWCGVESIVRFSVVNSANSEIAMSIRPWLPGSEDKTWPGEYDFWIGDFGFSGRMGRCVASDGATCAPETRTIILPPRAKTTWQLTSHNFRPHAGVAAAKLSIRVRVKGSDRRALEWSGKLEISRSGEDCWRAAAVQQAVAADGRPRTAARR